MSHRNRWLRKSCLQKKGCTWEKWSIARGGNGPGGRSPPLCPSGQPVAYMYRSRKVTGFFGDSKDCKDFRDVPEGTEIPEQSLWQYINHWKAEGILDTVRHHCTQVFFKTLSLWEAARKPLADLCSVLKIGFKKIFGQYFVDSGIIRPFRERNKNLKPTNSSNNKNTKPTRQHQFPTEPPLIVESYQEANRLSKELKELGISPKIAVVSNSSTIRSSRVIG